MKIKQELENIKNKDLSGMTNTELFRYRAELAEKMNSANKAQRVGLKKAIYYGVSYLFGIGIGLCVARVLMTYIYTGSPDPLLPNLGIALLNGIPIAIVSVFFRLAKRNAQKLSQACNDKIMETDRQIAIHEFRAE